VKSLMRGLLAASLAICLPGLSGCGTDNESDALNSQQKLGAAPPPAAGKVDIEAKSPPSSAAGRTPPGISPELRKSAPAKK